MAGTYNTVICEQKREDEIFYEELGSYQGEWILFTWKGGFFSMYEGGYGSCSSCDDYEGTFGYTDHVIDAEETDHVIDAEETVDFVARYTPTKIFTIEDIRQHQRTNPLLYGFIPMSTSSYHESGYDQAIVKGIEACILHSAM